LFLGALKAKRLDKRIKRLFGPLANASGWPELYLLAERTQALKRLIHADRGVGAVIQLGNILARRAARLSLLRISLRIGTEGHATRGRCASGRSAHSAAALGCIAHNLVIRSIHGHQLIGTARRLGLSLDIRIGRAKAGNLGGLTIRPDLDALVRH